MNYHPKHKSNSRTAVWIGAGVLAAVAIGAIIFISITLRTPMTKEEARAKAGIVYDSSATEGGWDNLSPEEIEARLNEKVAEGMINISANTAPIFEDGSSEGNLMLVNESINTRRQRCRSTPMIGRLPTAATDIFTICTACTRTLTVPHPLLLIPVL